MKKVYQKQAFDPEKAKWYPGHERLWRQMGSDPQRYLNELRNPFNTIMGQEFPESAWKGWDAMLLTHADNERVNRILGEEEQALP